MYNMFDVRTSAEMAVNDTPENQKEEAKKKCFVYFHYYVLRVVKQNVTFPTI